ncbi:hypothetical protein AYI70_g9243 [Smittium culicis]|uniref:Uncharacterized protein n=1 Tax=Smittium culicis TaxID=133412 RepID=A0A1R1XC96_9FUNG|nr:hypothetical protein AYI70_g9243 [Smittium culicis]
MARSATRVFDSFESRFKIYFILNILALLLSILASVASVLKNEALMIISVIATVIVAILSLVYFFLLYRSSINMSRFLKSKLMDEQQFV